MDRGSRIRGVYEAINRREFEEAAGAFGEGTIVLNVATGEVHRGRAGYLQVVRGWVSAFPDCRLEILQSSVEGDRAVVEYVLRGRHTGALVTSRGHIPPTGMEIDLRVCDVLIFRADEIEQLRSYFDSATLLRQLGLLANSPLHGPERRAPLELFAQEVDSTLPQRNKAVVRRFLGEVLNRRNPGPAADTCAANVRWHGGAMGEARGLTALQQLLSSFFAAFPDLQVEVEDTVAQDDLVVARISMTGTHLGEFQGIPATGKRVAGVGTTIYRLADGRIVEEWWQLDLLSLMQQLDVMPSIVRLSARE